MDADQPQPHVFASGAQRSELKPRYDLIPCEALVRLAQRYTLGAAKYGEYNWQKGMPPEDTLNHIINHLLRWREKSRAGMAGFDDDDLGGAMWGIAALMYYEAHGLVAWGEFNRAPGTK